LRENPRKLPIGGALGVLLSLWTKPTESNVKCTSLHTPSV